MNGLNPVSFTMLWGEVLRDDPDNGCEGDYLNPGVSAVCLHIVQVRLVLKRTVVGA